MSHKFLNLFTYNKMGHGVDGHAIFYECVMLSDFGKCNRGESIDMIIIDMILNTWKEDDECDEFQSLLDKSHLLDE